MNAAYVAAQVSLLNTAIVMAIKTMPWASAVAHASRMQMVTAFAMMLTTAWVPMTR